MASLEGVDTNTLIAELMARSATKPAAPVELVVHHLREADHEFKDSIEIGTPGRGGTLKIYFDAGAPEDVRNARVDAAFATRAYAQLKLAE